MTAEEWNSEQPDIAATLSYLNRCFDGGWDENLYRWYLARPFNGRTPDRIIIRNDGEAIAGSVINYRQLLAADGTIRDIGIASGSWTLPEARGQGLFTRMMQASVSRAGDRACEYFLAFVTADNASRNALERCGAAMIPASYISSGDSPPTTDASVNVESVDVSPSELHDPQRRGGAVRFYYESSAIWAAQQLERPLPVDVCRVHGDYAIVERAADTDRLLWSAAVAGRRQQVAASLAARASAHGRKFFMYSTSGGTDVDGLVIRSGFVCCLPTESGHSEPLSDLGTDWDIQSGDRL